MDLAIENLSFSVKGREILKDIALSVERGEFVGIIGPNGSGKSTLLKNVYRVLNPTSGKILLFGKDIAKQKLAQTAREMATVSQFHRVNFDFSVEDMVMMGRIPYQSGLGKISAKDQNFVDEALNRVGLTKLRNHRFLQLSGGEQQRVVLARALAQEPKFLLLDEPTNHLDIHYQLQLMEIVADLNIGVLAVLHDLNLAAQYCNRIYVLQAGKIIASGKPKDLFTADLIKKVYRVNCSIIHDKQDLPIVIYERGSVK